MHCANRILVPWYQWAERKPISNLADQNTVFETRASSKSPGQNPCNHTSVPSTCAKQTPVKPRARASTRFPSDRQSGGILRGQRSEQPNLTKPSPTQGVISKRRSINKKYFRQKKTNENISGIFLVDLDPTGAMPNSWAPNQLMYWPSISFPWLLGIQNP